MAKSRLLKNEPARIIIRDCEIHFNAKNLPRLLLRSIHLTTFLQNRFYVSMTILHYFLTVNDTADGTQCIEKYAYQNRAEQSR